MFVCQVCGRKFKTIQSLGGHVRGAHPNSAGAKPTQASAENSNLDPESGVSHPDEEEAAELTQVSEEAEEPGIGEQIRGYIAKDYDFAQLTKKFGFSPTSVRREMEKMVKPASEEARGDYLPDTYKQTEVMNPEALMRRYTDGSREDELELRGMMKLRGAMLMVLDLANIQEKFASAEAKRLEPLLKVLQHGREELDAAAARASGQSFQMAQEAAEGAVSRVIGYINDKIPKAPPPKDTSDLVTRRVDKMLDMMFHTMESQMMPGQVGKEAPEGWEYQGPQSQPQTAFGLPTQPQGKPSGWTVEREQDKEKEDSDND